MRRRPVAPPYNPWQEVEACPGTDKRLLARGTSTYTRAEPRDFLDVDAAVVGGRHTRERLCELAEQADAGFDRSILADLFGMLDRYPDRHFAAYDVPPDHVAAMRHRFAEWRAELLDGPGDQAR